MTLPTALHCGQQIRIQWWVLLALGLLTLALVGVIGWQLWHPPSQAYARALGALDTTLSQTWNKLPKDVQQSLESVYARMDMSSTGEQQTPRK